MKKHHKTETGGKAQLLEFISNNEKSIVEPMFINIGKLSEDMILQNLAPYWFQKVATSADLTPLGNAKKSDVQGELWLNKVEDGTGSAHVNERLEFCYPQDKPEPALFAIAIRGGLVVLYAHDIVWFYEPNGDQCWGRMN